MARTRLLVIGVVLVVLAAAVVAGCRDNETTGKAGLYPLDGGRWRAVGVLGYEDLEGGFYAVYEEDPALDEDAERIAVVANGADLNAASLRGRYVEAIGTKVEVSVRQAGTELQVETLREIERP